MTEAIPTDRQVSIPTNRQVYRVALASIIGSVIEQYDFLVTGVIAATVWGSIFFKLPQLAAIAAAIRVYGIGIIIRPIGAYIFGHIADRRGRKDAQFSQRRKPRAQLSKRDDAAASCARVAARRS